MQGIEGEGGRGTANNAGEELPHARREVGAALIREIQPGRGTAEKGRKGRPEKDIPRRVSVS